MPAKPPEHLKTEEGAQAEVDKPRGYRVGFPDFFNTGEPTTPPEARPTMTDEEAQQAVTSRPSQTRSTQASTRSASTSASAESDQKSEDGGN